MRYAYFSEICEKCGSMRNNAAITYSHKIGMPIIYCPFNELENSQLEVAPTTFAPQMVSYWKWYILAVLLFLLLCETVSFL